MKKYHLIPLEINGREKRQIISPIHFERIESKEYIEETKFSGEIINHRNIWLKGADIEANYMFILTGETWTLEMEKSMDEKLKWYKNNCIVKFRDGYIMPKTIATKIFLDKTPYKGDMWEELEKRFFVNKI